MNYRIKLLLTVLSLTCYSSIAPSASFNFGNNWKQKAITGLSLWLAYNIPVTELLGQAYFTSRGLANSQDMPESADSWYREQLKEVGISNTDTLRLKEMPGFANYAAINMPSGLIANPAWAQQLVQALKDYAEQIELKEHDPEKFDQQKLADASKLLTMHRFLVYHEAGHLHGNHPLKHIAAYSSGLLTLPLFLKVLGSISHNRWISKLLLGYAHSVALSIIISFYARSHEQEADEFAIAHSKAEDLKVGAAFWKHSHKSLASHSAFKGLLESKAYESLDDLQEQSPWLFEFLSYASDQEHPASVHRAQRLLEAAAELEQNTRDQALALVESSDNPEDQA
jgi:hypothetical protein